MDTLVKLVHRGPVINGAYPVYFQTINTANKVI